MIDEDKIILLTNIAAYEQEEGKDDLSINGFFRGDYMGVEVFKAAIYGTIGFAVIFLMYMLYDLENFMVDFYKMDIVEFAQGVLSKYVLFVAIYIVISYFVALYRYTRAKKHIAKYKSALKHLYSYYI